VLGRREIADNAETIQNAAEWADRLASGIIADDRYAAKLRD
jgi:hypothetical protein